MVWFFYLHLQRRCDFVMWHVDMSKKVCRFSKVWKVTGVRKLQEVWNGQTIHLTSKRSHITNDKLIINNYVQEKKLNSLFFLIADSDPLKYHWYRRFWLSPIMTIADYGNRRFWPVPVFRAFVNMFDKCKQKCHSCFTKSQGLINSVP